ncbi:MAG: membrane integrity-associated transporter subunit PqiC [Syntrophorhabdaceae bacterium]|nr:membrane integrity-associated transporter subunit PqiC [Syntrophorhabdaceae bacterium]
MKIPCRKAIVGAALIAVLLLLAGCSSTEPPRFYLLNPLTEGTNFQPPTSEPCISLGVGPARLPEYLDRPQIVTRATRDELALAQFDRWAEPLSDAFPRVLAQNLSRLLCTTTVSLYPWSPSVAHDYRLQVQVIRMDGRLGEGVALEAWWSVSGGPDKKVLAAKQSGFTEPAQGKDYEALVQAHSRAIMSLCRDIAQAIATLARGNPPQK